MNNLMIAQISCTRQQDNGEFKRVKEQYIIPGDTFSTAEDFVFKTLAEGVKGEFTLQSLKQEPIEDIFIADEEVLDTWYKCKVTTDDTESDKEKKITLHYYVNADSVKQATEVLEQELKSQLQDFETKSVVSTPIIDVHIN